MKPKMVIVILGLLLSSWALATEVFAYNLRVENVSLYRSAAQPNNTIGVKFDVLWDGYFNALDDNGKAFFDRAWIFVKFFDGEEGSDTAWKHAMLIPGGTVGDYNSDTGIGITADKKGAFCRPGRNQIVYWNYGASVSQGGNNIAGTASVKVKVFAIEMCYVTEGAFYVGSGGNVYSEGSRDLGSFTDGGYSYNYSIPFKITSENALEIGPERGKLWGTSQTYAYQIGDPGTLSADFPKGYAPFYVMKYEISQGQYRDFINTLTRAQQLSYVTATSFAANVYCMAGNTTVAPAAGLAGNYRNSIRMPSSIPGTGPITVGCDYDNDGIFDEANDGEWLPCNYFSWKELSAYLDWAALRPMTELEFEKACRGPRNPIPLEYAWGTNTINSSSYNSSTLTDPGTANEGIASAQYSTTTGNASRPRSTSYTYYTYNNMVRCGAYAANSANTGRMTSGATYYGIMEMSGNVMERAITVGNNEGRNFKGSHGDGNLDARPTDWPVDAGYGAGLRGGYYYYSSSYTHCDWLRVSDRYLAASNYSGSSLYYGGRGVRTED